MKISRWVLSLAVVAALLLTLVLPAAADVVPPVQPPEVKGELGPGESMTVEKKVTTPLIPPKPDIYFLSDTTGSMWPSIGVVQTNASTIMTTILGLAPNAQFGVGNYKDFPYDPYAFQHQQPITANTVDVGNAIGAWAAGGGADGPEGQLYALYKIATDPAGVGWRAGSSRILVWFGDAPAHDPVPAAATGLGFDLNEANVTAALVAAGIRVIAVSVTTGYPAGLDDNPTLWGGDYAWVYGIVEDGTPGQATRIAKATGGVALIGVKPEDVVKAIMDGLAAVTTDVWWTVTADPGLTVTLDPVVYYDVEGGTTLPFIETITVAEDAPQCKTLTATVTFWANSYPKEGAVIGEESITVKVKDITKPEVASFETANPAGKKVPPAGSTTLPGPKGGMNEDGFYVLKAWDNCDKDPMIYVVDRTFLTPSWDGIYFGPFPSGTVVKFTEAKGAVPNIKKIGSTIGQAGYVDWHITLPTDAVVVAVDHAGNWSWEIQYVPPLPK